MDNSTYLNPGGELGRVDVTMSDTQGDDWLFPSLQVPHVRWTIHKQRNFKQDRFAILVRRVTINPVFLNWKIVLPNQGAH